MKNNFQIREANPTDAVNILMLKIQVWLHTYATEGVKSEYADYLASEFTKEKTEALISNPNKKIFLVEKDSNLIACCQIDDDTPCPVDGIIESELSVLYVSQHFHGQGVGYDLLTYAESWLKGKGYSGLWLTAYYKNEHALDFYNRQNYKKIGTCFFEMGENQYENWVFYKDL